MKVEQTFSLSRESAVAGVASEEISVDATAGGAARNKGQGEYPARPQPMGLQVGNAIWSYGWYFNAGWISATVYFSPRFTAYLERSLDDELEIANKVMNVSLWLSGLVASKGGAAAIVAGVLGAVCGFVWDWWTDDISNNIEQAIARKPDGCLTMKVGYGTADNGGIDFNDVARKNKYCTEAKNQEG